ncbi:YqaJ viral recombinase family protein [Enterococcus diestrammenae]|uniref:YqaJ viral recombinase family nuclease n=1 Tax=Enterococcus diestrammenae TaxID=1155073 RepID=UPI0022E35219|nr:YqaJ viral recombinase family protein [Enterococcus diestrammenae]
MSKSTLEMTHDEWLLDRRRGIGGSDVSTILGLNKWKSAYQLWLEKTGQVELDHTNSEPAYWGNVLEEVVAKEFQERTGLKVRRRNQVFEHPLHPFLRANIDRDVVGEKAILECKTANQYLAKEWEGDEIPISYLCQVQHYMNVMNYDHAYIAVLIGGQKFIWKRIERDQKLIDMITERLVEFWETNIIEGVEPPIDGSKAASDFLNERYSEEGKEEVRLPESFDELIRYRDEMKESEKIIKEEIAQLENRIKSEMGKRDAVIGITPKYVITWKSVSSNRLNKKLLTEKYPEAANDPGIYQISISKRMTIKEIG